MKIEVGQDAFGDWAWMAQLNDGRLIASAQGFASPEDAMANATQWIGDLAEWQAEYHGRADRLLRRER